jgi:hypothetical protein
VTFGFVGRVRTFSRGERSAGWLIRYAWKDGKVLAICPACQRPDEQEILARLHE